MHFLYGSPVKHARAQQLPTRPSWSATSEESLLDESESSWQATMKVVQSAAKIILWIFFIGPSFLEFSILSAQHKRNYTLKFDFDFIIMILVLYIILDVVILSRYP